MLTIFALIAGRILQHMKSFSWRRGPESPLGKLQYSRYVPPILLLQLELAVGGRNRSEGRIAECPRLQQTGVDCCRRRARIGNWSVPSGTRGVGPVRHLSCQRVA